MTERRAFENNIVEADSVEDFLNRYYVPRRYKMRGDDYAASVLKSHQERFENHGYTFLSRHESNTGVAVAYYGAEN